MLLRKLEKEGEDRLDEGRKPKRNEKRIATVRAKQEDLTRAYTSTCA